MIKNTPYEKQLAKEAKKSFKQQHKNDQLKKQNWLNDQQCLREKRKDIILTGILEGETILSDDIPVYYDYYYVVDDNGGKVVRSNVEGNVRRLKNDLQKLGYKAENIHRCEMGKRKMF